MRTGRSPQLLVVLALAISLAACSVGEANSRVAYWKSLAASQLPPGTALEGAKQLFSSHGLDLRCCVNAPPEINHAYYAVEKDAGRLLWMSYSVMVVVDVSTDGRVQKVQVQRISAGL